MRCQSVPTRREILRLGCRALSSLGAAAALSRAQRAQQLLRAGKAVEAQALAREAVEIDPLARAAIASG